MLDKLNSKSYFVYFAIVIALVITVLMPWKVFFDTAYLKISFEIMAENNEIIQLFYSSSSEQQYTEEMSKKVEYTNKGNFQKIDFEFEKGSVKKLRLDIGDHQGKIEIKNVIMRKGINTYKIFPIEFKNYTEISPDVGEISLEDEYLLMYSIGNDPFINIKNLADIFKHSETSRSFLYEGILIFALMISLCILVRFSYKNVKKYISDISKSKLLVFTLAKNEMKNRYTGSFLGVVWAFVQPIITICVFWFVFEVGFKSSPIKNVPFILWLICGMIPWFFISEGLQGSATSVIDNSFLVKKVVFKVNLLPIVRLLSALFIHIFFLLIVFLMFFIYGYIPDLFNLQVIYYLLVTVVFLTGVSWITSCLTVFIKDFGQIISIIIQFGFWLTPIFWSYTIMPDKYMFALRLNPIFYLIEGCRDSFINKVWFWDKPSETIYFGLICIIMFVSGVVLFEKLKSHFADIL